MLSGTHGYVSMKQFKSLFPEGTNHFFVCSDETVLKFYIRTEIKIPSKACFKRLSV